MTANKGYFLLHHDKVGLDSMRDHELVFDEQEITMPFDGSF